MKRKNHTFPVLIFLFLFATISVSAQQTVGLFDKEKGSRNGYVLFSPNYWPAHYLIDKCGKLVHKWNVSNNPGLDAYLLPNGNLLATGNTVNPYFSGSGTLGGLIQIYDWNDSLIWSYKLSDSLERQDHDVYPMPNGNILVCVWERHIKSDAIANGKDSTKAHGPIWSAKVEEIQPVGSNGAKVVWQWSLWDHLVQDFDSNKANYGTVSKHPELMNINFLGAPSPNLPDWTHINAVTYNADLDQVMISSRNLSEIWIVDHNTTIAEAASHSGGKHNKGGDLLYRYGNPAAYNRGKASDQQLFVQHNSYWIPKGYPDENKIMIFNDGTGRPAGTYSSVDIIVPPVDKNGDYTLDSGKAFGPVSPYWTYVKTRPQDFYSAVQGGAQRLPNGNTLITESTKGKFFEIDSAKNIVWEYLNPVGINGPAVQTTTSANNAVFRATLYDLNYPAFKKKKLAAGDPLELYPFPYSCYMPTLFDVDPLFSIKRLKGMDELSGVADSAGKGNGFIKGVVHSKSFTAGSLTFSIIDSTGAITVYTKSIKYYSPAIGDSVLIQGKVIQVNGVTQYAADSIVLLTRGKWLKTPKIVTILDESTESDLVKIRNCHIVDTTAWFANGKPFDVNITNGTDTFVMRINTTTDLYKKRQLNQEFNVTGIASQDISILPYTGNYLIQPRGISDIEHVDQLYTISQVRNQNFRTGVADSAGTNHRCLLKGVVQSPDFDFSNFDFALKDSTGSLFVVSKSNGIPYIAKPGDSIEVRGVLTQKNGVVSISVDSISKISKNSISLTARRVTKLDESTEAELVKFTNAWLVEPDQWVTGGSGFNVDITNGKDTIQLHIANVVDLFSKPAPRGRFNVTGIGYQNKPALPYIGAYQLMPRGSNDLQLIPYNLYKIRDVKGYDNLTGIADSINTYCLLKGVVQSQNLSGTVNGFFALQDSTGTITITSDKIVSSYTPNIGDSIALTGTLKQINGLTNFDIDSVNVLTHGTPISPVVVTALNEKTESGLVTFQTYQLANNPAWDTTGANGKFNVKIFKGTDTVTLAIMKGTDLYDNGAKPSGYFDVTGIGSQNDPGLPYLKDYVLIPRSIADFQHSSGIALVNPLDNMVSVYPNPATNALNIKAGFKISTIQVIDILGQVVATEKPNSGTLTLDLSTLQAGVYYVKIDNGTNSLVKKIIKQ